MYTLFDINSSSPKEMINAEGIHEFGVKLNEKQRQDLINAIKFWITTVLTDLFYTGTDTF